MVNISIALEVEYCRALPYHSYHSMKSRHVNFYYFCVRYEHIMLRKNAGCVFWIGPYIHWCQVDKGAWAVSRRCILVKTECGVIYVVLGRCMDEDAYQTKSQKCMYKIWLTEEFRIWHARDQSVVGERRVSWLKTEGKDS